MIGWLGVALSGTDAGSNALFGSFQVITANKLGLSPILMGAANSAGGVMGKMIAAQSLVIGCAVTGQEGQEGALFRAVLKHSLGLAGAGGADCDDVRLRVPGRDPERASLLVEAQGARAMDDDDLVTVAVFGVGYEAEMAKGFLEANDVDVFLADREMARIEVFPLIGGVKLQVRREDAARARELLAQVQAEPEDRES